MRDGIVVIISYGMIKNKEASRHSNIWNGNVKCCHDHDRAKGMHAEVEQ